MAGDGAPRRPAAAAALLGVRVAGQSGAGALPAGVPSLVEGKRVLDFGSGGGLAAIAAAQCGAARVVASDVDPLASVVQAMNAELNGVAFERVVPRTWSGRIQSAQVDVVLVGDVCFERETAERLTPWLRDLARRACWSCWPTRAAHYAPTMDSSCWLRTTCRRCTSSTVTQKRTRLWRVLGRS